MFMVYRELLTSLPLRYHFTVGAGRASNWQLQLALVFIKTIDVLGRCSPIVGGTVE